MKESKSAHKANLVYGLIAILPLAVMVLLLSELMELLSTLGKELGLKTGVGVVLAVVLAVIFLLVVLYALGALVRTRLGALTFDRFEQKVLLQIPGYQIISSVLKGVVEHNKAYPPVSVCLQEPGVEVLGFVTEENENGTVTVFVPSTPAVTMGRVYIVARERVTFLQGSQLDVVNCVADWGMGSNKVLQKEALTEPVTDTPQDNPPPAER